MLFPGFIESGPRQSRIVDLRLKNVILFWVKLIFVNIVLHAGFHKSGTTSLQQAFLDSTSEKGLIKAGKKVVLYPRPTNLGPGHCELAQKVQLSSSPEYDPDGLLKIAKDCAKILGWRRRGTLLLSSECFTNNSNFEPISQLANAYKVHLVLTRRPVFEALPSLHQEMIKHGDANDYLGIAGLEEAQKRMQFHVSRIDELLNSAKFSDISVISTTVQNPSFIFDCFNRILNTNLDVYTRNQTLETNVIQELVRINKQKSTLSKLEKISLAMKMASKTEDISIDAAMKENFTSLENEIHNYFHSLAAENKIRYLTQS